MKRRDFLKILGVSSLLPGQAIAQILNSNSDLSHITILHTNDTHARIDPFPDAHPRYGDLGGFARRAAYVNQVRKENKNTLLLDAGDVFQGTPYFNLYKGKLDYKLMSMLKYDATTLGNHEFDNGVDGLANAMSELKFPMVNANYWIDNQKIKDQVKTFIVKEVGGVRFGIFGLGIEFKGLVLEDNHEGLRYRDALSVANGVANNLKKYLKCDYVICLSHLGYDYKDDRPCDTKLAKSNAPIDLIIGGHTHTFMKEPDKISKGDRFTLINQVGFAGIQVGRIDLYFSKQRELIAQSHQTTAMNTSFV